MKKFALALFLAALHPGLAQAAGNSTTVTGTAGAAIIAPISMVHWAGYGLNFGTFAANIPGTVTVSATTGAGSVTGGVTFMSTSTTAYDAFLVTLQANQMVNITTSAGTVTSGSHSMTFTTAPSVASGSCAGTTCYFTVGGTLNVNGLQAAGTYNGTYTATVTYQ